MLRTLTGGQQVDYGVHITLPEIRLFFRDYDYQLKTYRYHPLWRVRAVELIRKMLHHFELVKKPDTTGSANKTSRQIQAYDEKTTARVMTYLDGNEKEETNHVVSFLPQIKDAQNVVTRLVIKDPESRKVCAAQGYVAIRVECWWRGLKGRRSSEAHSNDKCCQRGSAICKALVH